MIPVAIGTNGVMAAFSKVYKDEDLAIQTQFHIAESYFELFKSHRRLKHDEEAAADLASGRRVLRELQRRLPESQIRPARFLPPRSVCPGNGSVGRSDCRLRLHRPQPPGHNLAPDSQYKLGQCHEEAGELDEALEAYVTLAGTYPKSPLIANVMLRINEHFYVKEDYAVAASVGSKFLERFPNHEWTPRWPSASASATTSSKNSSRVAKLSTAFAKRFPDQELTAQALFWAGESYRMGKDIPNAFRRYNRCRWDFPESDAAKYSRGRLALPELLAQFEREANLERINNQSCSPILPLTPSPTPASSKPAHSKLLLEGGLFMWPLLALLILAIAVIIERYRSLKLFETDASALREEVTNLLSEDKVEESLQLCDAARGPVPAVLSSGLRKYLVLRRLNYDQAQTEQQVIKSMENYGTNIVAALERTFPSSPPSPRSPPCSASSAPCRE